MKEKTQKTINTIIGGLTDEDLKKEVVPMNSPEEDIRQSILGFFNSRIAAVNSQERLKLLVQDKLEECIESGDLTFTQLKDLFIVLSRESTNASQDVLKIAHPNPGQSPLANDFSKPSEESKATNLTSEEQRKLDTLYRLLGRAATDTKKD